MLDSNELYTMGMHIRGQKEGCESSERNLAIDVFRACGSDVLAESITDESELSLIETSWYDVPFALNALDSDQKTSLESSPNRTIFSKDQQVNKSGVEIKAQAGISRHSMQHWTAHKTCSFNHQIYDRTRHSNRASAITPPAFDDTDSLHISQASFLSPTVIGNPNRDFKLVAGSFSGNYSILLSNEGFTDPWCAGSFGLGATEPLPPPPSSGFDYPIAALSRTYPDEAATALCTHCPWTAAPPTLKQIPPSAFTGKLEDVGGINSYSADAVGDNVHRRHRARGVESARMHRFGLSESAANASEPVRNGGSESECPVHHRAQEAAQRPPTRAARLASRPEAVCIRPDDSEPAFQVAPPASQGASAPRRCYSEPALAGGDWHEGYLAKAVARTRRLDGVICDTGGAMGAAGAGGLGGGSPASVGSPSSIDSDLSLAGFRLDSPSLSTDLTADWCSSFQSPDSPGGRSGDEIRVGEPGQTLPHCGAAAPDSPVSSCRAAAKVVTPESPGKARRRQLNRPKHNHSKVATDLLKQWFYRNLHSPFPSDEVKAAFADRTGLNYTQVSNWFVNARKRVWKPYTASDPNHAAASAAARRTPSSASDPNHAAASAAARRTPSSQSTSAPTSTHGP